MKLLIALKNNKNEKSELCEHFGHCPYFAIYNSEDKNLEIIENKIDHNNENKTPVDQMMEFNPDVVFTLGIGQRALKLFSEKRIEVKSGKYQILSQVIENINNLEDFKEGCNH